MYDSFTYDPEAKSVVSAKEAFEKNVLPLKIEEGTLHLGVSNAEDHKLLKDIGFNTGLKIKAVEIPEHVILRKLKEVYSDHDSRENKAGGVKEHNTLSENSTIEYVNRIISNAIKISASDIHIETHEKNSKVRYRIDGHLREVANLTRNQSLPVISRIKIMANLDISERRRPQDGKIKFNYNERDIDIRVSSLPTSYGEKVVLRILDKDQLKLDLAKIGMNDHQLSVFRKNLILPYGMILVTGPTGSGKTTTLYAALKSINNPEKNILTIEDPVEYNLEGVNQSNVKHDIGYDFASALRSFLRQDPDIIMVGEIRDKETAEIAIRASLTGHLVLSTLHTNDSVSAVTRLIDMGIEPFLVSSCLRLVVAQRLVRKLCNCKVENNMEHPVEIKHHFDKNGCTDCGFTGFSGRTAIFELFEIDGDTSEQISKGITAGALKNLAESKGLFSLRKSGCEKVNLGITTYEEVLRETML